MTPFPKICVSICTFLIAWGGFAADESYKFDVYSTPEYKRLSESFSIACEQNKRLKNEVASLKQVTVHADLKPEDREKIDRLLKANSMIEMGCRIAAGFFALLSCILFLVIIGLLASKNKWKTKAMQFEKKSK